MYDDYVNAHEEIIEAMELSYFDGEDAPEEARRVLKEKFEGARLRIGESRRSFKKDHIFESSKFEEFIKYMKSVNYDAGYGSQNLFGFILLDDETWFERYAYDGQECWVHKSRPNLNDKL